MKRFSLIALVGMVTFLWSCSLDHNESPNDVLAEDLTPNLRLSAAQVSAYEPLANQMNDLGNKWTNAWSGNTAQFGNPMITESTMDISTSFNQAIWNDTYRAIARFQQIIDVDEEGQESFPYHIAIAKIQKAFYMEFIVDLYGDAPYSEAFVEQEKLTPSYDKDVDIYAALVDELLEAKQIIADNGSNPDPNIAVSGSEDVIFGGDMDAWDRFANTILLKYAIHLSETTDSEGVDLRDNVILPKIANADFIDTDVTINPGYSSASDSQMNPLFKAFGSHDASGAQDVQAYWPMAGSLHIIQNLLGDSSKPTSGIYDSRIEAMFMPVTLYGTDEEGFDGFRQGDTNNDFKEERGFSSSDNKPANGNISLLGSLFRIATFDQLDQTAANDGYLMTKAEIEFLLAEAAVRSYPGFSAGSHFEDGIQASFDLLDKLNLDVAGLGFDPADGADYITSIANVAKVGLTGNQDDDIYAIQYQRWIALTNINGIEPYINYLRTGYPETPLATTANHPNKPWRLLYPASEYSSNSAKVPDVSLSDIFEKNEFTPFIYK